MSRLRRLLKSDHLPGRELIIVQTPGLGLGQAGDRHPVNPSRHLERGRIHGIKARHDSETVLSPGPVLAKQGGDADGYRGDPRHKQQDAAVQPFHKPPSFRIIANELQ